MTPSYSAIIDMMIGKETEIIPKRIYPWSGGRFSTPTVRRRFAIGDIHGCSRTLRAMMAEMIRPEPHDIIYLLGDYIDRGPDSKEVLDYLMDLFMGDCDLRPLRGNHEQMLLDAIEDSKTFAIWKANGGYATLKEFGISHPRDLPQRYLDFLNIMPLMHLMDDYVLVHAGLDFRKDNPIAETSSYDLLWARDYRVNPVKLEGRTLVTGHSRTQLFAIHDSLQSCHINLDNGCFSKGELGEGALVALNLDTRELLVQMNCE